MNLHGAWPAPMPVWPVTSPKATSPVTKTLQAYVPINTFVYNNAHNMLLKIFSIHVYSTFQSISSTYTGSILCSLSCISSAVRHMHKAKKMSKIMC